MKTLLIAASLFFIIVSAAASDAPKPILKPGEVKHFIKTFPLLKKELGIQHDARHGNVSHPGAFKAGSRHIAILKKHGWDEKFYDKAAVILLSYSSIVYGEEKKEADKGLEESLKEIDANPNLSDEMKEMMKKQIKTVKGALKEQQTALKQTVHLKDLELVRPFIKELKQILEK